MRREELNVTSSFIEKGFLPVELLAERSLRSH